MRPLLQPPSEAAERRAGAAGSVFDDHYEANYNVAPTTFQAITRQSRDTDDRKLVLARWGLAPFFAKSLADFKGFSTFNARAESSGEPMAFAGPWDAWREPKASADAFDTWLQSHKAL